MPILGPPAPRLQGYGIQPAPLQLCKDFRLHTCNIWNADKWYKPTQVQWKSYLTTGFSSRFTQSSRRSKPILVQDHVWPRIYRKLHYLHKMYQLFFFNVCEFRPPYHMVRRHKFNYRWRGFQISSLIRAGWCGRPSCHQNLSPIFMGG